MNAKAKLIELAKIGSEICGQPIPLGFDVEQISATTEKLPHGLGDTFKSLLTDAWPSDFFLGAIEFLGPDRINAEHRDLYPGLTVIGFGFVCFGSDGAGTMFTYCTDDGRVYLLPNEYFTDDGLRSRDWDKIETDLTNIKSLAIQSWDSMDALLDWALVELRRAQEDGVIDRD